MEMLSTRKKYALTALEQASRQYDLALEGDVSSAETREMLEKYRDSRIRGLWECQESKRDKLRLEESGSETEEKEARIELIEFRKKRDGINTAQREKYGRIRKLANDESGTEAEEARANLAEANAKNREKYRRIRELTAHGSGSEGERAREKVAKRRRSDRKGLENKKAKLEKLRLIAGS